MNKNFLGKLIKTSSSLKSEIVSTTGPFGKMLVILTSRGNDEISQSAGKSFYIRLKR